MPPVTRYTRVYPMTSPFVIGVAGGSGSGKTTVTRRVIETVGSERVAVLNQDNYYRDQSDIPFEARLGTNYDHPAAFDWALLREQLDALLAGVPAALSAFNTANALGPWLGGMAIAAHGIKPDLRVVGVESAGYPSAYAALQGDPNLVKGGQTIAEGIAVRNIGKLTIEIIRDEVAELVRVGLASHEELAAYSDAAAAGGAGSGAAAACLALARKACSRGSV